MNRNLVIGAVVVVVGLLFLGGFLQLAMTGYDGIESTVNRVQHPYGEQEANIVGLGSGSCTFDPSTDALAAFDVNGIHITVQQPNILGYEDFDDVVETEIIEVNGEEYEQTKTWKVRRVSIEMFVHLWTTGTGFNAMTNTKFWIRLQENGYSVFSAPDEAEAYILNVYTTRQTTVTGGSFATVSPMGEGVDVEINTIRTETIPQWILDSGYTGQLESFKTIEFPVEIVNVQRSSAIGVVLSEADISMYFGADVLLFGYWEETKPYREGAWDPPDLLGQLLQVLFTFSGIIVVVVAMVCTVIILIKIQHPWVRAFAVIAVWLGVFVIFLMIGLTVVL